MIKGIIELPNFNREMHEYVLLKISNDDKLAGNPEIEKIYSTAKASWNGMS